MKNNLKIFTISKVGYSAGVYGCSGEYFILTYTKKDENNSIILKSIGIETMYGGEYRVKEILLDNGYVECYNYLNYGQVKARDYKNFMREYGAIEYLKNDNLV